MNTNAKIYVAGHRGMVGSAIVRNLQAKGYANILTRARSELDLLDQRAVFDFLAKERPDYIFLAAAKVGGIQANNTYRGQFVYENLAIEANIIHGAHLADVDHLCFLGSSCIYPRDCPQPIKEEYLLSGPLEQTNEPYAIAKIAGLKLCESYSRQYGRKYVSAMPTNLYGPNDNYDLNNSHVLPALIRKVHLAKLACAGNQGAIEADEQRYGVIPETLRIPLMEACAAMTAMPLIVWGSGTPRREFLHVDDMADACVFMMENEITDGVFNVGTGTDVTIRDLAEIILDVVWQRGKIIFDSEKPDGTQRKLLDVSKLSTSNWIYKTQLIDGIKSTYRSYREQKYK